MRITYTKKADGYQIKATLENGTVVERHFPEAAVQSIMKVKGLTEKGAVEYLAIHTWVGQDSIPPPSKAPVKPPVAAPPPPSSHPVPQKPVEPPKMASAAQIPPPPKVGDDMDNLLQEMIDAVKEEKEEGDEEDEEEEPEEEEPTVEQWDDYNWLMEQARRLEYFSRPGIQSKKKEDLQKWLRKKLKK